MSHVVKVKTNLTNIDAIKTACERLGLSYEINQTASFYSGSSATGTAVQLPGWNYPVVVAADGECHYDNYNGRWGNIAELNKLRQTYARCTLETILSLSGMAIAEEAIGQSGELILTVRAI
jgi:hypothetical protein